MYGRDKGGSYSINVTKAVVGVFREYEALDHRNLAGIYK